MYYLVELVPSFYSHTYEEWKEYYWTSEYSKSYINTPPPPPLPQGLSTYIHVYYLFIYLLFQAGLTRGGGGLIGMRGLTNSAKMMVSFFLKS